MLIQFSALAATVTITVGNNFYSSSPQIPTVRPGDIVRWQWQAGNHPTVADNNEFAPFAMNSASTLNSITIPANAQPATVKYHCTAHAFFNTSTNAWEGMVGSFIIATATAADEAKPAALFSLYPNPSKGVVMVSLGQKAGQTYKLRLSNLIGREVRTVVLKPETNGAAVAVNLADLPAGIYFYSLLANDKLVTTKRLVLQN
ncbi:Por secretion system C-terminal sorting domain-containing protein [Hymenobacter daecheongensis DSM 21074]|uniref:Por secretion system C-terminal sorting domain-containing protein n=2 Tax=Hymenobacter daecheongensis TaxID=496053 RepID=A0A1M6CUY1_9BACT|nr:Por secretion system C-terminal sorting domain-containing protein [Hymenobacter daecheongensis DSM 21074]